MTTGQAEPAAGQQVAAAQRVKKVQEGKPREKTTTGQADPAAGQQVGTKHADEVQQHSKGKRYRMLLNTKPGLIIIAGQVESG
jgi:hypothetical protein